MREDRLIAFDVETPNKNNDRISSIAISYIEDGQIVDSKHFLVNPEVPFSSYNIQLTGIHPEDVQNAPSFPKVWAQIADDFAGHILIAHNAAFDISVLEKTLKAYALAVPEFQYVDTLAISREVLPCLENHRLNTLCEYYHIPLEHHNAESDSIACAKLYLLMAPLAKSIRVNQRQDRSMYFNERRNAKERELVRLLDDVSSDGKVTDEELSSIIDWLSSHPELSGTDAYIKVESLLTAILADGVIEQSEMDELVNLLQKISNPAECACCSAEGICLTNKVVCITGEFRHGPRPEIIQTLTNCGAIVKTHIVKRLDYLIVGDYGSEYYAAGKYGRKMQQVLDMQEHGSSVQILKEDDLYAILEANNE